MNLAPCHPLRLWIADVLVPHWLLSGSTRILHSFSHSTHSADRHRWLGWPPQESLHSQNLPSWDLSSWMHSWLCGRILSALHVCCRCVNYWHNYHNDTKVKCCDCVCLTYFFCGSLAPCEELFKKFELCYWLIDHGMMIYGGQFLWQKSCGWDKACICRHLLDAMAAYVMAHWTYQIYLCAWFICNSVFLRLLSLDQSYHRALPLNMHVW